MMVAEGAAARNVSTLSAASWLNDAWFLDDALPYTLEALADGQLSLWSARAVSHEVDLLNDVALIRLADEIIAEDVAAGLTPAKIKKAPRTRVLDIDPAAAPARFDPATDRHRASSPTGAEVLSC